MRLALIRQLTLLAATVIGLVVCYLLTVPFVPALAWALVVAVLAAPLHRRLQRRLGHPNVSAAISVLVLAVVVFLPLALLAQHLVVVLSSGMVNLQAMLAGTDWQALLSSYPTLARIGAAADAQNLAAIFGNVSTWLTNVAAQLLKESLSNAVTLLLTFYFLFYFLRDRRGILRQLTTMSPFSDAETRLLFGRVADTIHGIVFGTIVTAAVQGTLGGAIFWLLELPNALFWGVVMGMLAIIPVLGAFVIWVPATLYLALTGEWGKAAILAAYGGVIISLIDNLLHPALTGGRLQLHTVPMLIAIVGGIIVFGASGLILGPLAVVLTIAVVQIWRERVYEAEPLARAEQT